jgi:hypothetical protein
MIDEGGCNKSIHPFLLKQTTPGRQRKQAPIITALAADWLIDLDQGKRPGPLPDRSTQSKCEGRLLEGITDKVNDRSPDTGHEDPAD